MSEDGSVEGSTPLAVSMSERPSPDRPGPGFEHDSRRRIAAARRGQPATGSGAGDESPASARGGESEMARLFRGPASS